MKQSKRLWEEDVQKNWVRVLASALLFATASTAHAQGNDSKHLVIAIPAGAIGDFYKTVAKPWEDSHPNVTVDWINTVTSTDIVTRAIAEKAAPQVDLIHTDSVNVAVGDKEGVWEPLDPQKIPNIADLAPGSLMESRAGVAWATYYGGIFYRTDVFEKNGWAAPTGWDDLFRPEFCGKVGLQVPTSSYTLHMLLGLAHGDVAKVPDAIARIKEHAECFPVLETVSSLEQKIASGEYVIGVHGAIRVIPLTLKGVPVRFVKPAEYPVGSHSTISRVRNGPGDGDLANDFINFLLSPETQTQFMTHLFYGPVNQKVVVTPELEKLGVPVPGKDSGFIFPPEDQVLEHRKEWGQMLERALAR
jgi:putative spermidine/putrescine transport system substrate-binding protein